jgi:predicted secreted Zn-dependent protease
MEDFEGLQTSVEEVTADVLETEREPELKWSLKLSLNYCNLTMKL